MPPFNFANFLAPFAQAERSFALAMTTPLRSFGLAVPEPPPGPAGILAQLPPPPVPNGGTAGVAARRGAADGPAPVLSTFAL